MNDKCKQICGVFRRNRDGGVRNSHRMLSKYKYFVSVYFYNAWQVKIKEVVFMDASCFSNKQLVFDVARQMSKTFLPRIGRESSD